MGVKGLWRLIESSGAPIQLETLEQKVLAVDISIWLHQAVKSDANIANSHLLTLFHRICKLIFYRIKPIFVFDGGIPHLKKQTVAARRLQREIANKRTQKIRERLLQNLIKTEAIRNVLTPYKKKSMTYRINRKEKDLFELPPLQTEEVKHHTIDTVSTVISESVCDKSSSQDEETIIQNLKLPNLHNFELDNKYFKMLSLEKQHEVLSDLQETRKHNSWNKLNEMPQVDKDFSDFQMERLLKRRKFQKTLDDVRSDIQKERISSIEVELFGNLERYVSLSQQIISEDESYSVYLKDISKSNVSQTGLKETYLGKNSSLNADNTESKICENQTGMVYDDTDTFSSDENEDIYIKENDYILNNINSFLETGDLTQSEIFELIRQSEKEVDAISEVDISAPCTSSKASGQVCSATDAMFDIDDDFIDVTDAVCQSSEKEADSHSSLSTKLKNDSVKSVIYNSNDISDSDDDFIDVTENTFYSDINKSSNKFLEKLPKENSVLDLGSNIDSIMEAKSDSIYIKISKQKIDDMLHSNVLASPKKSCVEAKIENDGDILKTSLKDQICNVESHRNNCSGTLRPVMISLDSNDNNFEDNIFKGEFSNILGAGDGKNTASEQKTNLSSFNEVIIYDNSNVTRSLLANQSTVNTEEADCTFCATYLNKDDDLSISNENSDSKIISRDESLRADNLKNPDISLSNCSNKIDINKFDVLEKHAFMNSENKLVERNPNILNKSFNTNEISSKNSSLCNVDNLNSRCMFGNSTLGKDKANIDTSVNKNNLEKLELQLCNEERALISLDKKNKRVACNMSSQMYKDAQELLQLFGIPYLVAPMEAEAQCAFLDLFGLCHGIITDDSDVFLFGGKNVYKNFCNQSRHIEYFQLQNIERIYGLNRLKLISLALLTGSDYTLGIESVGSVTALEILSEFSGNGLDILQNFKRWWQKSRKRKLDESDIRHKFLNLTLPENFPSENVYKAYLNPIVDSSLEQFSWAIPNIEALKNFATDKFGWSKSKCDDILVPVLKRIGIKETQMKISSYFTSYRVDKELVFASKRVKEAIAKSKGIKSVEKDLKKSKLLKRNKRGDNVSFNNDKKQKYVKVSNMNKCTTEIIKHIPEDSKEERKQNMFKALLQKQEISQKVKDKEEMGFKKKKALEILHHKNKM